jgi:SAM-dependent methyltransferase
MDIHQSDFEITQDFYGEPYFVGEKTIYETGYSDYVDSEWTQRQAALCARYFPAKRMLDVGCATGFVTNRLRAAGHDAWGTDFSAYAVSHGPPETASYRSQGSILALPYPDNAFDLVICLETVEHLWPRDVDQAIAELYRVSSRWIFVSIPSFGYNDFGPPGLEIGLPSNLEDAQLGLPFREIPVDTEGNPHHGHLTLATFQWWTERFLAHGLWRLGWLERQINKDPDADPVLWQFYALQKDTSITAQPVHVRVTKPYVLMGENDDDQLGRGWHEFEPALYGRWTSQKATAYCLPSDGSRFLWLEYSYPTHLEDEIQPTVDVGGTAYHLPPSEKEWARHLITLEPHPTAASLPITFQVRHSWTGEQVVGNEDRRPLGVAVRRIYLTESEWQGRIQIGLGSGRHWLSGVRVALREWAQQVRRTLGSVYRRAHDRLRGNA